eukprot:4598674-Amphidinium_carterae.1
MSSAICLLEVGRCFKLRRCFQPSPCCQESAAIVWIIDQEGVVNSKSHQVPDLSEGQVPQRGQAAAPDEISNIYEPS